MGPETGPPPPRSPEPGEGRRPRPCPSSRALPPPPTRCPGRARAPSCALAAPHAVAHAQPPAHTHGPPPPPPVRPQPPAALPRPAEGPRPPLPVTFPGVGGRVRILAVRVILPLSCLATVPTPSVGAAQSQASARTGGWPEDSGRSGLAHAGSQDTDRRRPLRPPGWLSPDGSCKVLGRTPGDPSGEGLSVGGCWGGDVVAERRGSGWGGWVLPVRPFLPLLCPSRPQLPQARGAGRRPAGLPVDPVPPQRAPVLRRLHRRRP